MLTELVPNATLLFVPKIRPLVATERKLHGCEPGMRVEQGAVRAGVGTNGSINRAHGEPPLSPGPRVKRNACIKGIVGIPASMPGLPRCGLCDWRCKLQVLGWL